MSDLGRQPFTVAMLGSARPVWGQGTYRFQDGTRGSFELTFGPDD